jgi:hypothetical protein
MALTSTLSGAQLAFKAERVDVPLGKLVQHGLQAKGGESLAPPKVRAPQIDAETFSLNPVRALALKEIIRHAASGRARISLPFPLKEIDAKVTTVQVPEETRLEIDVVLEDAAIVQSETVGRVEPPLPLPLGLEVRGAYLDDAGDVLVDITGLPDINLSKRGLVPRIPPNLDELLHTLFPEEGDEGGEQDDGLALDTTKIEVEAWDLIPREETFHLGSAGEVLVGADTRLDLVFAHERLIARGKIVLQDARLHGTTFDLAGIKGVAELELALLGSEEDRRLSVELRSPEAQLGLSRVQLADGTTVQVSGGQVGLATVSLQESREGLRFQVGVEELVGEVDSAVVVAHIGETSAQLKVGPFKVEGAAKLSEQHVDIDVNVAGAELQVDWLDLDLDVLDLALAPVTATADGHLKAGTDYGFSFSGALDVVAEVASGVVAVEQLRAQVAPRSKLELSVAAVGAGPEGLDVLEAKGRLDLRFGSGSVPLGPSARVSFSDGALGTVLLDEVAFSPGAKWPRVKGSGHLVAESDTVRLEPLVELPPGRASVDATFEINEEEGHLVLEGLSMRLASREE